MNVLLIDDERMEREGIIFLSRRIKAPLQFFEAKNGREGLDVMARTPIDIVIVDIKMPVMGGLEFLQQAAVLYPNTKYVIYSAYSEFEYAKEAIKLNVLHYLVKPVDEEEFYQVMRRVVAAAQEEKRAARREALRRAIRGISLPEDALKSEENIRGVSVLLLFDHAVLDSMGEQMTALTHAVFPDSEVFIENEYECIAVLPGVMTDVETPLARLLEQFGSALRSGCQAMVGARFDSYVRLKETVQQARQRMNAGFFTRKNAIVFAEDLKNVGYMDCFRPMDAEEPERNDLTERIDCILSAIENADAYSNIYTKYTLIKRIEQVVRRVEPHLIEKMLAAHSLKELRETVETILRSSPQTMEPTEAAKDYIRRHYDKDISIDDIADHVLLNSNYLCALFKKETGSTLISYLTDHRMNVARQLVSETTLKYSEIAKQVGYRNPSYFNMIFKNYFGCTPSGYRAGERGNA